MKKRFLALAMAATMVAGSLVGCGGNGGSSSDSSSDAVKITIFNSKSEVHDQFLEMAEEYSESHEGVEVEVYMSNDTVAAHLASKYAANEPYTLSMVDAKDVYSLAEDHALDLSDQEWVGHTTQAVSVNDKVYGFPVCVEARGIMYNKDAIEAITGEEFKPEDYATLTAFKGLLDKLVAGGMAAPVGIMKEDWSLAGHFISQVYEEQEDTFAFVDSLYAGEADLANNAKFNSLMDTFDVLKEYNYAKGSEISAERETSEQKLAMGEIAFMFGGNWDWSLLKDFDAPDTMGMMPVPQDMDDGTNTKLVGGGSKYFFIDSSDATSDEQKQAAKDFLNWLVMEPEGNAFLTEKCSLVPAYDNIGADALDPLSKSVKAYADAEALVDNYNYLPDDHYSMIGAKMQEYLSGGIDRAKLADEITSYWKSVTPVER
ncbi:MAG: ABC transporter substrate-binding protein [Eubacteriales bacterium]|nr:ABC transporter substrate-binding protein [Eubacteriales bacterium]